MKIGSSPWFDYIGDKKQHGDIIQMLKNLHNIDDVDTTKYFVRVASTQQGHKFMLFKRQFNHDVRKYSFTDKLICGTSYQKK